MRLLYFITTLTFISINALTTDVVTGLNYPLGLAIDGNDIYIAEQSGNKVSKIDITATTPTTSTDVTNVNYKPTGLAIKSGLFTKDLYISAFSTAKIFKLDLNASSPALIEFFISGLTYPRPAGLTEKKKYKIYNLLGSEIKNGNIINNEKININDYINGLYFLKFNQGNVIKFLKE